MKLKNNEWKVFKIGDIFTVSTGALIPKEILKKGEVARITATENNNGIFDFYEKVNHKNYRELTNFISVSFLGGCYYHPYTASLDMKIHAVQIPNVELNRYIAEFLVFCFKRMASSFSYGDQLSSADLPKKKILLPANEKNEPDYTFMEEYMRDLERKKIAEYKAFIDKRGGGESLIINGLQNKQWKVFSLTKIFSIIQRGKRLKKDDHIEGETPYASSTALNNGIDGFIGNTNGVRTFKNCLTIANSGSVGATFFQPFNVVASDHVTKLESENLNKYTYLFLANIISRVSEKYSFNREINDQRIKKEKILLPVNSQGEPDYKYMEQYMKMLEYIKLTTYLDYKKRNTTN